MRALVVTAFGGPEVLKIQDVPEPSVRELDILIEVHASSLNPVDTKIRSGGHGQLKLPLIPGYDVSGVVKAMGSKVEHFSVGDEVYASPNLRRDGAHAELVAVDARSAARKPKNLDHVHAAALPLVTLTAWESIHDRAEIHTGETVLIHAGAGGVGHIAVQLAKIHDCRVITTASRDESIALCKKLGADVVINYAKENVVERVMKETNDKGCEVVFDTVGGEVFNQSMDCVALNGRLAAIVYTKTDQIFDKLFRKNATLHLEFMGVPTIHNIRPEHQGHVLRTTAELVEAGKLKPHVSEVIGLEDVPRAHADQVKWHTMGKRVVKMK